MKRGALLGIVAGALVIIVIWYVALYKPKTKDLSKAKTDLAAATSDHANLQQQLAKLQALAKEGPALQARLERLQQAVPDKPSLDSFILDANTIALSSGVTWMSIAPTPPGTAAAGLVPIALGIQLQGTFNSVLDYLHELEQLKRLVIVDTLNLSTGASATTSGGATTGTTAPLGANASPILSVTITARMFTGGQGAASTGGAAGTPSLPPGVPSPGGGTTGTTTAQRTS